MEELMEEPLWKDLTEKKEFHCREPKSIALVELSD